MVGSAIKKFANEVGLKLGGGVAYGVWGGYMLTLVDGMDIKKASFSCAVTDDVAQKLNASLNEKSFKKQYRISHAEVRRESVTIVFVDTVGTMKKVKACLEVLPSILMQCGAIGDGFCTACGNNIDAGAPQNIVLINGVAHRIHSECAASVNERSELEQVVHKTEDKNLARGVIGALAGALLGGVVWGVAYYFNWFIAVIGVLIAFLAKKGYELLGGKVCKAKTVVIMIATAIGAIFGQVMGDFAVIAMEIQGTEYLISDIPFLYIYILSDNPEALSGTLINLVMGLLFAFLGAYLILKKTLQENTDATLSSAILE